MNYKLPVEGCVLEILQCWWETKRNSGKVFKENFVCTPVLTRQTIHNLKDLRLMEAYIICHNVGDLENP